MSLLMNEGSCIKVINDLWLINKLIWKIVKP
jgi:hypothetical protein